MSIAIAALLLTTLTGSLKLAGVLDWSWWWIGTPIWLVLAGMLIAFARVWIAASRMK